MRTGEFAQELQKLRVFRNEHVDSRFLENLEAVALLQPRIRIRFPDPVARRMWKEDHEHIPCQLKLPVEPDGSRWVAAVELLDALHRWQHLWGCELAPHPLDNPTAEFRQFLEDPATTAFESWRSRDVDVSSDAYGSLFDDLNVMDFYTSWQLLFAVEIADAGIKIRLNLVGEENWTAAHRALQDGRLPQHASYSIGVRSVHAAKKFAKYERSLDAIVWFLEERTRVLWKMGRDQGGKRSRLTNEQSATYRAKAHELASMVLSHFRVGVEEIVECMSFLAEGWDDWDRNGSPRVAAAYKEFLAGAIILVRTYDNSSFALLSERVGQIGGGRKPVFEVIWPDWSEQEKERARATLRGIVRRAGGRRPSVSEDDVDAFVGFLATEGFEAFFWRLRSFEDHDLRGNEYAAHGMRSDIQGMAIVVEHIASALGATATQLYEKFKQLWGSEISDALDSAEVGNLARNGRYARDWSRFKRDLRAIREQPNGELLSDLVVAHRLRGGIHEVLDEDDPIELEALFLGLMRVAFFTFVEVRRKSP